MNITVEKQPKCLAKLQVEVPADVVNTTRETILQGYTQQARIPGFRPGKAPRQVIEKRYQNEISEELESRLVQEAYQEAIRKEELKVIDAKAPENKTYHDDGAFSYSANLILAPEFSLPSYKGLEIAIPSSAVEQKDIDNEFKNLQERMADFSDIEGRSLEMEDFAVIDYSCNLDGKPVEEVLGRPAGHLGGSEGYWVKMDEEAFLPGFAAALVGLKKDDQKEITITIPEDFPAEELRGADVTVDVTVKELKSAELPELNDEFAAKLIPGKSFEELQELLTQELTQQKERQIEEIKIDKIIGQIVEAVDFDLPEEIVKAEAQGQADQMVRSGAQQGLTDEVIESQQTEILETAQQRAVNNLKSNFLLQEIALEEKIQVEEQEMLQRIHAMAQQANKPVKKFIKEMQKDGRIGNLRHQLLTSKTIDFLIAEAKITIEENSDA